MLGPLEVCHERRPVRIPGGRQRELLAILLLHAGEVVSTDRLMDALWGEEQPAAGAAALRVKVSQLRKALGLGEALVTRSPGYALRVERDGLDLRRFERELEEADRSPGGRRRRRRSGAGAVRALVLAGTARRFRVGVVRAAGDRPAPGVACGGA